MKKPTWYKRTLPERAVWHSNFAAQAVEKGAAFGLVAADIQQIQDDNTLVQYLADSNAYLDAEMDNWRGARDAFFDSDKATPMPVVPAFALSMPPANAKASIIARTVKFAEKIELSDNYTKAIGVTFGIVATKPEPPPIDSVKPKVKGEALPNWKVSLKVALKGFDGVRVEMMRGDADAWVSLGMFPNGDIVDDTPPLVPNKPETRQYRVIFVKKNSPVGEYSDIISVTIHA